MGTSNPSTSITIDNIGKKFHGVRPRCAGGLF